MSRKLDLRHAAVAYLLNKELGYNQSEIGKLMKTSQGTISNMIKEFEYESKINNLQKELSEARQIIQDNHLLPNNDDFFDL